MHDHTLEDFRLLQERRALITGRLATLRQRPILTEAEELEQLRLEKRLVDLEPWLELAEREASMLRSLTMVMEHQRPAAQQPSFERVGRQVHSVAHSVVQTLDESHGGGVTVPLWKKGHDQGLSW
jgi:hypothetical protein